jgi:hypothetical protein
MGFPSRHHIDKYLNPFSSTGTLTAEVRVPGPGGPHILERQLIISASSYTFSLGHIGVNLVAIYEGKPARFPYELHFFRLYTQLTLDLVSMVENKWNMHPSFSHLQLVRKADGWVCFIIVIDVTRSHVASIYKVQALSIDCPFLDAHLCLWLSDIKWFKCDHTVVSIHFCTLAYSKVGNAGDENTLCHILQDLHIRSEHGFKWSPWLRSLSNHHNLSYQIAFNFTLISKQGSCSR